LKEYLFQSSAQSKSMNEATQTLGEEIANSISHGVALLVAIVAQPFLIIAASHLGISYIVGASVFAVTMVMLYLTSTLYHALPVSRAKRIVLKLDHGAIYFFIAGSYTPFALTAMTDALSWLLFILVWSIAILGAALKVFDRLSNSWVSTGLYVVLGWLALMAALPLIERMPEQVKLWLIAGGVAYSVGVIFYIFDSRLKYAHTVWHCFVMLGTACHFMAVLNYEI
jgi:hemolysin III